MTAGEGLTAEALTALCYEVEDLFDACRIRIADYDSPHLVVRSDDYVVAALVSGDAYAGGAPSGVMRFSVCVCPYHRRQGHARRLVEAFIEHCEEQGVSPEAWVVNDEAMRPLLEDLGFTEWGPSGKLLRVHKGEADSAAPRTTA